MKETIYTTIFHLLVLIPLFYFGFRKEKDLTGRKIGYIGIFALFYLLWNLVYLLPYYLKPLNFINGNWNWESKILAFFMGIIFLLVFKDLTLKECGITIKQEQNSIKNYFMLTLLLCMIIGGAIYALLIRQRDIFSWETVLFEISIPGLEEELIFRGILLALLNKAFSKNFSIGNGRFGWGLIILSLTFGLIHGLEVKSTWQITFDPLVILLTGFMGFCFGWIKERTGSLLLPIIIHNLTNSINTLIVMLK